MSSERIIRESKATHMEIQVIINPGSKRGSDRNLPAIIRRNLRHAEVNIAYSEFKGHAHEIAAQAVEDGAESVIVVGGDGTINEVVNVIANTAVSLGVLPAGTANDLASLHGIPIDVGQACEVLQNGHQRRVDLICVNGRCYVTGGGVGLPSEVALRAESLKRGNALKQSFARMAGHKIYTLAFLTTLFRQATQHRQVEVTSGCCKGKMDTLMLMINNQHFLGSDFIMTPGAKNNDGQFDVCWIQNNRGRIGILDLIMHDMILGKHVDLPFVQTWRDSRLIFRSEEPLVFFGDGEILHQSREFNVTVLPGALCLIVPDEQSQTNRSMIGRRI